MKRLFILILTIAFFLSGCSFDMHWVTPAPTVPVEATESLVTPIVFPSAAPVSAPTGAPVGFTPNPDDALFYAAYAVTDPVDPRGRSAFPAGTERIYVLWHYQNMSAGMMVKREWLLDGKVWLTREEPWDFAKYGAFGIMQDVSIYDLNTGLPSGVYQLQMYIDGVQQPIGADTMFGPEDWLNFQVLPHGSITEAASPDSKWSAAVINGNRLTVRDVNGAPSDIFEGAEIPHFAWFPDSRHIVFVSRDRSGQVGESRQGIRDELWIADVARKENVLLYESETMLGVTTGLSISPDGRFFGISEGTSGGDACFVLLKLLFFEIAPDFGSIRVMEQKQFDGIPGNPDTSVYPTAPGTWLDATHFSAPLSFTCVTDESLAGEYVFDLVNGKASRK